MNDAIAVILPIRAFTFGKARLAADLDDAARAELARTMADGVATAAAGFPTLVVSSAPEVVAWAEARGLATLPDPGSLDDAASAGSEWARDRGAVRVVVAHADLPFATSFEAVVRDYSAGIVTVVPCHRDDGTTVLSFPVTAPFRFAYGPGSFRRHVAEAGRLGLGVRVVRDASLAFDVDIPADLSAVIPREVA